MPYEMMMDTKACPAGKPIAVKKQMDGRVMGCHATEADAQKQMDALKLADMSPADHLARIQGKGA